MPFGTKRKFLQMVEFAPKTAHRAIELYLAMRERNSCVDVGQGDVAIVKITDAKYQGKSLRECEQAFGVRVRSAPTATKLPEKNPDVKSIEHYGVEYSHTAGGGGPKPLRSIEGVLVDEIPVGQRFVAEDGYVWLHARRADTGDVALCCTGHALIGRQERLQEITRELRRAQAGVNAHVEAGRDHSPRPGNVGSVGSAFRAAPTDGPIEEDDDDFAEDGDDGDEDAAFLDDEEDDDELEEIEGDEDEQLAAPALEAEKSSQAEMMRRAANYKPDPTNVWGTPEDEFDFTLEIGKPMPALESRGQMTLEGEYLAVASKWNEEVTRLARAIARGDAAARAKWTNIAKAMGE